MMAADIFSELLIKASAIYFEKIEVKPIYLKFEFRQEDEWQKWDILGKKKVRQRPM